MRAVLLRGCVDDARLIWNESTALTNAMGNRRD